MAKTNAPAAPAIPAHGRTPENTPVPGGGSWTWDADSGAWVDTSPKPTEKE